MCQYSAKDGHVGDWHLVHLGKFAQGGAGVVFAEATAVERRGRITHGDTGIWDDAHIPGLQRIASFVGSQGAVPGIQLAHAGRKASMARPWYGNGPLTQEDRDRGDQPWSTIAPTETSLGEGWIAPRAFQPGDFQTVPTAYPNAVRRLGDRRDENTRAARAGIPDPLRRARSQGGRRQDPSGRPDPHAAAGGGSAAGGQRRPHCRRPRGALRPELAAARRAGARRGSEDGALAGAVRLVAHAARGPAKETRPAQITKGRPRFRWDYTGRPASGRRSHADSGIRRVARARVGRAGAALALQARARSHPLAAGAGDRHRDAARRPAA